MAKKLGELLVREKLISAAQLQKAREEAKLSGSRLGSSLTKLGYLKENDLANFLGKQYGVQAIDLRNHVMDPSVLEIIPKEIALKHQIVPVNKIGNKLYIAMADPSNVFTIDEIKFMTNYHIEVMIAPEEAIKEAIEKWYAENSAVIDELISDFTEDDIEFMSEEEEDAKETELLRSSEEAPVIKLANYILIDAIKKNASDIHIEPYEKMLRVRYRIDGILYEILKPPLSIKNALVSRIKIMAMLDIAEKRLPQDGRIKLKIGKGKEMDYRVSVLPTLYGEKVVLRLLDKSSLQLDMTKLGFLQDQLDHFRVAMYKPFGMILLTGPTGSGKTTTLYSTLSELNKISTNISTAEDPIEYNLPGINQVQMHEDIGLNFASALRAFLRQDPDIIMVGEVRDFETAEIAIKAALTGHLVLSTLHTNDAPGTISRLLNMGIEPFLVASSVNLIGAQRLARKVCQNCKVETAVPEVTLKDFGFDLSQIGTNKLYKGSGCDQCNNTGYKGRVALYEIMPINEDLREFILNGASTTEIKREAIRLGMRTLRKSGIKKILEGVTTIEEVGRVSVSDES